MTKYEIFDYEVWYEEGGYSVKGVIQTGICICTDTSKSSIGKKLNLDPYRMDVICREGNLYINYAGIPYCELHKKE